MNMYEIAEYEALRATIRERGTVRMCLILTGLIAWAGLTLALNAWEFDRAASVVPLTILAATFEISFFIHTGVERIGRYLQVFYEDGPALSEPPQGGESKGESKGWENTIMLYGRNNPGGSSPLFITLFAFIAFVSFAGSLPAAARNLRVGWIAITFVGHLAFGWRLFTTRRLAGAQRALDLQRFRALKTPTASN